MALAEVLFSHIPGRSFLLHSAVRLQHRNPSEVGAVSSKALQHWSPRLRVYGLPYLEEAGVLRRFSACGRVINFTTRPNSHQNRLRFSHQDDAVSSRECSEEEPASQLPGESSDGVDKAWNQQESQDLNLQSSTHLQDTEHDGGCSLALEENKAREESWGDGWKARLWLLCVPLMWGTYGPALRFIYQQPLAPSPSILTLSRKVVSLVFFLLLLPLETSFNNPSSLEATKKDIHETSEGALDSPEEDSFMLPTPNFCHDPQTNERGAFLSRMVGFQWGAALELGLWTFLGTALQTKGLESTSATRAGFILQTITVLVPLLSAASGGPVTIITWVAAFLALAGVTAMSVSGVGRGAEVDTFSGLCSGETIHCLSPSTAVGDVEVLASTFFFALCTVRLGAYAVQIPAIRLSTQVMVVSTVCAMSWAAFDLLSSYLEGRDVGLAWNGLNSNAVAAAVVFSALVPGTLASIAQTAGQRVVPASEAQVYYSLQPVWSAVFAMVLLDETMSPLGWGAGVVVVLAAFLASYNTFTHKKP